MVPDHLRYFPGEESKELHSVAQKDCAGQVLDTCVVERAVLLGLMGQRHCLTGLRPVRTHSVDADHQILQ